jgi:four helix bundle protein
MDKDDLKRRTKQFALRIIRLADSLPNKPAVWTIRKQIVDAGTSVGANYRSACRARSRAEFVSKLGVVIEEADESAYWLELIIDSGLMERRLVDPLHGEANELVAIMVATGKSCLRRGVLKARSSKTIEPTVQIHKSKI